MGKEFSSKKEYLEQVGKGYDSIVNKESFRYYLERRKKHLEHFCTTTERCGIILDLGSGTGGYLDSLKNYKRLINIDLSFNSLTAKKEGNGNVLRINADILNIPLKNNSVDYILLIGALHHVPGGLSKLFEEILRVIKSGGSVFIDEANGYNLMWFLYMKLCKIDKVDTRPLFPYSIRNLAKKHGFVAQKGLFWGFVPPGLNSKAMVSFFGRLGAFLESSFFSFLCVRYTLILKTTDLKMDI